MSPRVLATALLASALTGEARGDGVAQVLTTTISPATVEVIDPESGSSSGGSSSEIRLAVGDIILVRFTYFPVPDLIVRGLQGYVTDYIPANTEVVGVRLTDASGLTITPRQPGISMNGCGRGCNTYDGVPCTAGSPGCSGGTVNLADGSIAQLYGDTGVFWTDDTRFLRNPGTQFITLKNGIAMSPEARYVDPIKVLLGVSGTIFAHNVWDWAQTRAFGITTGASGNSGQGNTPHLVGSPVAGPETHYGFEATDVAGDIRFDSVTGPWQRALYPGAHIGTGSAVTGDGPLGRMNVPTALGEDIRPLAAVDATAVRIAMGQVHVGEPGFAEIALRVTADPPIDPVQGKDVNCAEVLGGDTSAKSANVRALDNPWSLHLASPACVFLTLLFDLDVDKALAVGGTVEYTLHGKNLSLNPQTNVSVQLRFDPTDLAFVSATGGPTLTGSGCPAGNTCLRWPAMATLAPSDEYTFTATFAVGGGGHTTAVMFADYTSTQIPSPGAGLFGFTTRALTIIKPVAVIGANLRVDEVMTPAPMAGGTARLTGAITNGGTGDSAMNTLTVVLPGSAWRVTGALTLAGTTLTCVSDCATSSPTYTINSAFPPGSSRTLNFTSSVPAGTATGLHPIDLQIWGSQSAFGGEYETYFNDVAMVHVGGNRSTPPTLNCPITSSQTTITGTTSEASGTTIRLYFNLVERATGTSVGGGTWPATGWLATFGALYGGLEIRASAQAPGEVESELSAPCYVTTVSECSDGADNDGDGFIDFPADAGCYGPTDGSECTDNCSPFAACLNSPAACVCIVGYTGDGVVCVASCGDALVVTPEACDDGGLDAGDGCDTACAIEDGWDCTGEPSACGGLCGDGLVRGEEACDDGGLDDGDGCSVDCAIEDEFVCTGEPSTCSPAAWCGDGVLDDGEACDDGDDEDGDGCDGTCAIETGHTCAGEPSVCVADRDADGVTDDDDNCPDDANPDQLDGDGDGDGDACDPIAADTGCCSTADDRGGLAGIGLLVLISAVRLGRRRRTT